MSANKCFYCGVVGRPMTKLFSKLICDKPGCFEKVFPLSDSRINQCSNKNCNNASTAWFRGRQFCGGCFKLLQQRCKNLNIISRRQQHD